MKGNGNTRKRQGSAAASFLREFSPAACAVALTAVCIVLSVYRPPLRLRAPKTAEEKPLARPVVLILLDSLTAESASDPELMPVLSRLAREGASGVSRSAKVTLTEPVLTAVLTGRDVSLLDPSLLMAWERWRRMVRYWAPRWNIIKEARLSGKMIMTAGPLLRPSNRFAAYRKVRKIDDETQRIAEAVLSGSRSDMLVVHFYEADRAAHLYGTDSRRYREAARAYDRRVGDIARRLDPKKSLLIVLADHGSDAMGNHISAAPTVADAPFVIWGGPARPGARGSAAVRDFCPLLAASLGRPPPAKSLGLLPAHLLNMEGRRNSRRLLSNMAQVAARLGAEARGELPELSELKKILALARTKYESRDSAAVRLQFKKFRLAAARAEHAVFSQRSAFRLNILKLLLIPLCVGVLLLQLLRSKTARPDSALLLLTGTGLLAAFSSLGGNPSIWAAIFLAAFFFDRRKFDAPAAGVLAAALLTAAGALFLRSPLALSLNSEGSGNLINLAALALFAPLLRERIKELPRTKSLRWLVAGLPPAAWLARALAPAGSHAPYFVLLAAGAVLLALSRPKRLRDAGAALVTAWFAAHAMYYAAQWDVLVLAAVAWTAFALERSWSKRAPGTPAGALACAAACLFAYTAAGNGTTLDLYEIHNRFLLGGDVYVNIPIFLLVMLIKLCLPQLLLVKARLMDSRALSAFFIAAAAGNLLRLEMFRAEAVLHWSEYLPTAAFLLLMCIVFFARATGRFLWPSQGKT